MRKIEPRFERKGIMLVKELDNILEIIFFIDGKFKCGYTLNNKEIYVFRCKSTQRGSAIG